MIKPKSLQGTLGLIFLCFVLMLSAPPLLNAALDGIHINEVLFNPGPGSYQWVELKNSGTAPVNIAGYRITNETGAWYTIPKALPAVPSGAFVVVIFDGTGPAGNDYDFSDKVATIHSEPGQVNILGRTIGQCALYDSGVFKLFLPGVLNKYLKTSLSSFSPPVDFPVAPATDAQGNDPQGRVTKDSIWNKLWLKNRSQALGAGTSSPGISILSFVAWGGEPGNRADIASKAGLWRSRWYKGLTRGLGVGNPSTVPNESIGLLPGSLNGYPDNWTFYQDSQTTRGVENPIPSISWYYPLAGATLDGATFSVHWAPVEKAIGYKFQMAYNSNFSSLFADKTVVDPVYMPSKDTPPVTVPSGVYYWRVKVLYNGSEGGWSPEVQVKSLTLPIGGPLSAIKTLGITWQLQHKDTTMLCLDGCPLSGNQAWDRAHTERGIHGNMYCVRASISMITSYYKSKLSQDRITYELFKGSTPEGEMGHNIGCSVDQITNGLTWALGHSPIFQTGKPTYDQIKNWIDGNRPIGSVIPGHMRVIDGYFEIVINSVTYQFIHILDPWDREKWVVYADDPINYVWVGPAGPGGAPNVKSDESDLVKDSDGDGINDFDEKYRFKTNPNLGDSEKDWVMDKQEIKDYIFNAAGIYDIQDSDMDWDTQRKELDQDNDGGGMLDGCEDIQHTDNFNPDDDVIGTTTLISPTGTVYTSTPTYKWNAICGAQYYWLQVDDTTKRGKIFQVFTAAEAGCPSYTGTCSVTPSTSLANGNATWWINPCHWRGCGSWSNAMGFVVSGGAQDPIVGLWDTGEGGQALMEERTSGAYKFVAKVTKQGTWWTSRGITVGEEVWMLNKDPDGRYRGQVLVKGNFYWYMPFDVKVQGNQMIDNTNKLIATKVQ